MLDKMNIIERYEELYAEMSSSNDVEKMRVFGCAEKWAFKQIAQSNPRVAQIWVEKLEAMHWNNYLSDTEAKEIADKLVNQDGSQGAKWSKDTFIQIVDKLSGDKEKEPDYNENALWVTANMIYSDHAKSIAQDMGFDTISEVPTEKMALSCYRKAVEKLCDKDRKHFIREYFASYLMD